MDSPDAPNPSDRRDFLAKSCAIAIGGAISLVAPVAGVLVLADPLRHKSASGGPVLVTTLDALPENGEPRKYSVLATKVDAWNRTPNVPIGAIYLQRLAGNKVRALNVVCPHAGCFVDFRPNENHFHCPCHNSSFAPDGKVLDPKSPSPRGLDELPVSVTDGGEVWVTFQNFRAGTAERIPV
jgi:menaquinol-cytochrome c reductase iron-sulfur subunit